MQSDCACFMLQSLIQNKLQKDNSGEYALNTYPKAPMQEAAKILFTSISNNLQSIPLDSEFRIKMFINFAGAIFSHEFRLTNVMSPIIKYYLNWFGNPSFLGDKSTQNYYFRLIITQLSAPFEIFTKTDDNKYFCESNDTDLLLQILEFYDTVHSLHSINIEKETWITLLHTSIGIADSILMSKTKIDVDSNALRNIRQRSIENIISIAITSGISDTNEWDLIIKYCNNWSNIYDFIVVWGKWIKPIFEILLKRSYKASVDEAFLRRGIYDQNNLIPNERVTFVLGKLLKFIDLKKVTASKENMVVIAQTVEVCSCTAYSLAYDLSKNLLINKFPALPFLKLFGQFITLWPADGSALFDESSVIIIRTICQILEYFDMRGAQNALPSLVERIDKRCTSNQKECLNEYANFGMSLFFTSVSVIRKASEITRRVLDCLEYSVKDEIDPLIAPLYVSSSEVINCGSKGRESPDPLFDRLWKGVHDGRGRTLLIHYAQCAGVSMFDRVASELEYARLRAKLEEKQYAYIVSLMGYIGEALRTGIKNAEDEVKTLFPAMVTAIFTPNLPELRSAKFICVALQTAVTVVDYGGSALCDKNVMESMARLLSAIDMLAKPNEEKKSYALSLISYLRARLPVHRPAADLYTNKLLSGSAISEQAVIAQLLIKQPTVSYFTVGRTVLIGFIEGSDGQTAIFARGPYGKAILRVNEDIFGGTPNVSISDRIKMEKLPMPKVVNPPYESKETDTFAIKFPENADGALRSRYEREFTGWQNWSELSMHRPLDKKGDRQRLRVVDFLSTLGLVDPSNGFDIRAQTDSALIEKAIKEFDETDTPGAVVVPIVHVVAGDDKLGWDDKKGVRATGGLEQFLVELAPAVEVRDEAAMKFGLPALQTGVPALPVVSQLALFVAPEMTASPSSGSTVWKEFERADVRIVFNESGSRLSIKKRAKGHTAVVSPVAPGLYTVESLEDGDGSFASPFPRQAVMGARTIGVLACAALEQSLMGLSGAGEVVRKREEIIERLCSQAAKQDIAILATKYFPSK